MIQNIFVFFQGIARHARPRILDLVLMSSRLVIFHPPLLPVCPWQASGMRDGGERCTLEKSTVQSHLLNTNVNVPPGLSDSHVHTHNQCYYFFFSGVPNALICLGIFSFFLLTHLFARVFVEPVLLHFVESYAGFIEDSPDNVLVLVDNVFKLKKWRNWRRKYIVTK